MAFASFGFQSTSRRLVVPVLLVFMLPERDDDNADEDADDDDDGDDEDEEDEEEGKEEEGKEEETTTRRMRLINRFSIWGKGGVGGRKRRLERSVRTPQDWPRCVPLNVE